jgi:two-component system, cell cycle sensor histidine kinase and response regulator CckA
MTHHRKIAIVQYGSAIVSVTLAVAIRRVLDPLFGDQFPFAMAFLAVLATAWYAGLRPALLAVALGALACDYFLLQPRGILDIAGHAQKIGIIAFVVVGVGIALLAGTMHAARRRAEGIAASSRDQAALIDQTHDAVLVWDWGGPITFWNFGAERMYGYARAQALGRVSHELLRTRADDGVAGFLAALERTGTWEGELHHVGRDGREIDVESRMVLVRNENRSYVLEANRDISKRKAAEKSLRDANASLETRVRERTAELDRINQSLQSSEERYRLLIDGVQAYAIVMLDPSAAVLTWNAGAERISGYRAEEITGQHVSRFYPEEDIARNVPERELQIARNAGRCETESWRIRKDGTRYWARTVISALPGRGFALLVHDNTEGKRAAELLQQSEAKFRSYVENAPIAITIADSAGRFADCNPAAYGLFGRSASEMIGAPILSFCFEEDRARVEHDFGSLLQNGAVEGEYRVRRGDGSAAWVFLRAVTLKDGGSLAYCIDITARRKAESLIREERDWFANVVATVPVVICSFRRRADGSVQFPFANPRLESIYGIRAEGLAEDASPVFARMHPDDAARVLASIEASASTMTTWRCEFRVRHPVRGDIWVEGHSVPVLEANGDMLWQGYVADITERRRTEETLRATEASLRLMIEGVSDHAIFMLDPSGKILTWNTGAQRIDGYTAEEIIGRDFACLFTPEAIAAGKPQEELQSAAREGKADVNGWRVRKNGSQFWANGTVAALYDDEHAVRGYAKVTRDLTLKRRNDELLRSVLDNTLDAIITIDEQGTILMINHAGETIFDQVAADIIGQNVRVLMPAPYHSEHDGYLANYLRGGEAKVIGIGREVMGLRSDGSTFPLDLAVNEFRLDNQRFFVGIVRDISEKKTLERQLQRSQKMEAFGQLAGGVAHDFNNLLTVIFGYSHMLLARLKPDDASRTMVDEIRRAGERASALTRQLLAFTRQQVLEPRIVDLNSILHDIETMLRRLIGEDVEFSTTLREGISLVKVDPGQIEQVIMNLVVNSRDAMPHGGQLTIETGQVELHGPYARAHPESRTGRFVMLAISDTGIGMTPEVKSRIFEPFFTTKGGKGTGLGLAVVQGIVKQSGGTIEVYSEAGVGTTFKIYLPATAEDRASIPDVGRDSPPSGRETILLVEDEDGVRELAAAALEGFGYEVLSAARGSAALQLMAAHGDKIQLLLTDVIMPEMSGRQLAATLQAEYAHLKVLFLSGYTDDAVVRHGVLQSHVAFLQKPFTPVALARKVREVLDQGEAKRV